MLIDPPASRVEAAWAAHRAADRWLHLAWGAPEVAVALASAEERWELRPTVTALWVALRDGVARRHGATSWRGRSSAIPCCRGSRAWRRGPSRVLGELGLVRIDDAGVQAVVDPERRELESSRPTVGARARYEEQRRSCRAR